MLRQRFQKTNEAAPEVELLRNCFLDETERSIIAVSESSSIIESGVTRFLCTARDDKRRDTSGIG